MEGYDEEACYTIGGNEPNKPCVFPFILRGENLTTCISGHRRERQWCSTKVDENGVHIPGQWGYCSDHCCLQNKFQWASWSEWTDYCPTRDWTDTESKYGRRLRTRQSTQLVGEKKCYQEQSGVRICCDETCENVQLNRPSAYKERNWVMGPIKYN